MFCKLQTSQWKDSIDTNENKDGKECSQNWFQPQKIEKNNTAQTITMNTRAQGLSKVSCPTNVAGLDDSQNKEEAPASQIV